MATTLVTRLLFASVVSAAIAAGGGGVCADGPAIAEVFPQRVFQVDVIEINRFVRDWGDDPHFDQVVYWTERYDKHDRRWYLVDRGWNKLEDATFYPLDDGGTAVVVRDMRIEAKRICITVTPWDAELIRRDETSYLGW